ncbi:flagellar biosynthetic protein FliR [Nioella sp.]|uniref:flagellar biosynthetic protein FliR n=1 Tax=Nioella sp. TaxID=1912091 RepID=UPI003A8515FA
MTELLAQILGITQAWLLAGGVVFLRVGAAFLVLPAIGEHYIPMRIRLGAALAMTVLLTPALAADLVPAGAQAQDFAGYIMTETVAGLLLGLAVRLVAMVLQIAGSMAAQATSLSQIAGGATPEPQPAIAGFLLLAGLTLAVMSGLHVLVARMLMESYDILPAGRMPLARDIGAWGVDRVGHAFALAFSLAAPFLIASVLYNLALGVINKAMPQLMVAFVGAPAITLGGLVLLLLTTPFLLPVWMRAMQAALASPMGPLP